MSRLIWLFIGCSVLFPSSHGWGFIIECRAYKPGWAEEVGVSKAFKRGPNQTFKMCESERGGFGDVNFCREEDDFRENVSLELAKKAAACSVVIADKRSGEKGFEITILLKNKTEANEDYIHFKGEVKRTRTTKKLANWLKHEDCTLTQAFYKKIDLKKCAWKKGETPKEVEERSNAESRGQ